MVVVLGPLFGIVFAGVVLTTEFREWNDGFHIPIRIF